MMKLPVITSRDNARLKLARRVRDGREGELIFIEGNRLAREALTSGIGIDSVFVRADAIEKADTRTICETAGGKTNAEIYTVSGPAFSSLVDTQNSQGLIMLARRPVRPSVERGGLMLDDRSGLPLWLFLTRVNNPANLGAIVRTAEAAGAQAIFLSSGSADPFSPKALRASMGSAFRLPIYTGTAVEEVVSLHGGQSLITTAADVGATLSYTEADWTKPRLLLFGSEAHGLTETEQSKVDELIRIPMAASVESLNLAVACGVILFEARRQWASALSDRLSGD